MLLGSAVARRARAHALHSAPLRARQDERWTDQLLKKKKQRKMEVEAAGAEERRSNESESESEWGERGVLQEWVRKASKV